MQHQQKSAYGCVFHASTTDSGTETSRHNVYMKNVSSCVYASWLVALADHSNSTVNDALHNTNTSPTFCKFHSKRPQQ